MAKESPVFILGEIIQKIKSGCITAQSQAGDLSLVSQSQGSVPALASLLASSCSDFHFISSFLLNFNLFYLVQLHAGVFPDCPKAFINSFMQPIFIEPCSIGRHRSKPKDTLANKDSGLCGIHSVMEADRRKAIHVITFIVE